MQTRETARAAFRTSWRRRRGNQPYVYPAELSSLPRFPAWLRAHVMDLRRDGFPLPPDLVRLSYPPADHADSFKYMHAYGALYRCQPGDTLPNHVTFDAGIARMLSEQETEGIDVGVLKDILMVDYGLLKPVVLKVSWVKHRDEGRRSIRRDGHGFLMARLDRRDTTHLHNQYVFPKHVSQIFFMDDSRDSSWKVVISHEPRSKREMGEYDHTTFAGTGHAPGTPGLFPATVNTPEPRTEASNPQTPLAAVPVPAVEVLNALELTPEDDAFFDDDQYEDEYVVYEGP